MKMKMNLKKTIWQQQTLIPNRTSERNLSPGIKIKKSVVSRMIAD